MVGNIWFILFGFRSNKDIDITKIKTKTKNQKSDIKIVERGNIDTSNAQIYNRSLSWLSTDISIKSGGVKLILWAYLPSPSLSELLRPCIVVHRYIVPGPYCQYCGFKVRRGNSVPIYMHLFGSIDSVISESYLVYLLFFYFFHSSCPYVCTFVVVFWSVSVLVNIFVCHYFFLIKETTQVLH